jgi:hypothetical protein
MSTNPILGFLKTLFLLGSGRVVFVHQDKNRHIRMEDGARFRVFRHVKIRTRNEVEPEAIFIIRFRLKNMTIQGNMRFSVLPMMVFMGFKGFREKYWCVNDETGLCQGVYAWQTLADAENYAGSIAMRFMRWRSVPHSVTYRIEPQIPNKYWLFE